MSYGFHCADLRGYRGGYLLSRFRRLAALLFLFQQLEEVLGSGLQLLGLRLLARIVW